MLDPRTITGFRTHVSEQLYSVLRQPIVSLKTGKLHHYEWLVRFDHESGLEGVLRPAEISGAIKDLDLSMIAINISGASVDRPEFSSSLLACLTALEAAPNKLTIELTETWDMNDLSKAEVLLSELKRRGHPICIDDVGAWDLMQLRAFS